MQFFATTFKCVIEKGAALLKGIPLEDREYQDLRDSLGPVCLFFFTLLYTILTIERIIVPFFKDHFTWTWAELFINYQAGFIRRGLLGEILFHLQPLIPCFVVAAVLIFCAYLLFTRLVITFIKDTPLLVFLFLVFSPASFFFPIHEEAVFGRKEIFELCAFALVLSAYIKPYSYKAKVCIFVVLYTVAILIHESALFFAPLASCILIYSMGTHNKRIYAYLLLSGLFAYFLLLGFVLTITINHNYDPSLIVKSWSPYFAAITSKGPMSYLNKSFPVFLMETKRQVTNFNAFTAPFLIDFAWAILPIILLLLHTTHVKFFKALRKTDPFLFLSTIVSLLIPFLLFCFQDWGRWIYLITLHTFIFLIMLNNFGLVSYRRVSPITGDQWRVYILFLLCYSILWRMPHVR